MRKEFSRFFPANLQFFVCSILLTVSTLGVQRGMASDFHSPRTASLGGAGHAGPLLNDSIYLNPSFNSLLQAYSLSFNYGYYRGGHIEADGSESLHGHNLNLSIQDGRSELFQAGAGYTDREEIRYLHLGASKSFIQDWGVSLGGKFGFPKQYGLDRFQDATFSTSYILEDWVQSALIVDNIFETDAGKRQNNYREVILGTKFNLQSMILIYFDPHVFTGLPAGESAFGHETGIELVVAQDFFLRGGFFRNSTIPWQNARGRGWSLGMGWLAPRISLDYGMERANFPEHGTMHMFGMTIYF